MDVLNQLFVSLEDLDSVDYKISQVQIDSSNNEKLVNEILQENESVDKLNKLLKENVDSLNRLGLNDLVQAKIQQINSTANNHKSTFLSDSFVTNENNPHFKNEETLDDLNEIKNGLPFASDQNKQHKLLSDLRNIKIDIEDKFSTSFFFQDEVSRLITITKDYLEGSSHIFDNVSGQEFIKELDQNKISPLKKKLTELLTKLIEESNWIDSADDCVNSSLLTDINSCCLQLNNLQNIYNNIVLQNPQSLEKHDNNNLNRSNWSLEIICFPIISKFLYHFYGKSITNKLNQPDLPLEFFLNSYLTNSKFIERLNKNFGNIYEENVVILLIHTLNKFLKLKFKNDLKSEESYYFNDSSKNKTKYFNNLIYHLHKYQVSIFDTYYYKIDIITPIVQDYMEKWLTLEEMHVEENMKSKFPKS